VTSSGAAVSGLKLNFLLLKGTATVTPSSANTDGNGYAESSVHVDSLADEVDVRVCADGGGITCSTFTLFKAAAADLRLLPTAGSAQVIPLGHSFTPFGFGSWTAQRRLIRSSEHRLLSRAISISSMEIPLFAPAPATTTMSPRTPHRK
jgi:hypothetical protein